MSRNQAPVEISKFSGGLITEGSPLSFPNSGSIDESNMEFEREDSRKRRLGFDLEDSYAEVDTTVSVSNPDLFGFNSFVWENAGGVVEKKLLVVQVGNSISIYDLDNSQLSSEQIYTETFSVATFPNKYQFEVLDSNLVMVNGDKEVYVYSFLDGDPATVTKTTHRLQIRDLFGVGDYNSVGVQNRPASLGYDLMYTLRNGSWNRNVVFSDTTTFGDPVAHFYSTTSNTVFPSSADNMFSAYFSNPETVADRVIKRFYGDISVKEQTARTKQPQGHYVIDVLDRGYDRLRKVQFDTFRQSPAFTIQISSDVNYHTAYDTSLSEVNSGQHDSSTTFGSRLQLDITRSGSTVCTQFAGKMWFAGFPAEVVNPESTSPNLSSYVLFSQTVKNPEDIGKCYQEADPTDPEDNSIVPTDGGFIRLNEAYGIKALREINNNLFIFAENGVWRIVGAEGGGFDATNYRVDKVSEEGCTSAGSVVVASDITYFWSKGAIFKLARNEYGQYEVADISTPTIKTFYDDISATEKVRVESEYDEYDNSVHWVYHVGTENSSSLELVFNTKLQAFTKYNINPTTTDHKIVGVYKNTPYEGSTGRVNKELHYVVVNPDTTFKLSFGAYTNTDFIDWESLDLVGVDSPAYILTGAITGGTQRFKKQVPYLTVTMAKTETGFNMNYIPQNTSSCMVSSYWGWTDSVESNKWSSPFQAYRHRRVHYPSDYTDDFNPGETLVVTKSKIRGSGRSVAFKFESEPNKDMHIYGWAFNLTLTGED